MVAGKVINGGATGSDLDDLANHLHVGARPEAFVKLPNVDDISIEYQHARFDTFQIPDDFLCPAAIGAQVDVRKNCDFYLTFCHRDNIEGKRDSPAFPETGPILATQRTQAYVITLTNFSNKYEVVSTKRIGSEYDNCPILILITFYSPHLIP